MPKRKAPISRGPETILFKDGPMAGKTVREFLEFIFTEQIRMVQEHPGPPPMPTSDGWLAKDYSFAYVHAAFLCVVLHEQAEQWKEFLEEVRPHITPEAMNELGPEANRTMEMIEKFVALKMASNEGNEEEVEKARESLENMTTEAVMATLLNTDSTRKN